MGRQEKEGITSVLRTERRRLAKQSLSQFARQVGYSPSYLSAVELGYLPITQEVTFAYESALGLKAGSLIPGKATVARMLSGIATPSEGPEESRFTLRTLAGEGKLALYPQQDVLRTMITLMMEAAQSDGPVSEIFVTSQSLNDEFERQPHLRLQWDHAVRAALKRGWRINHAFRFGPEQQEALDVIESMFGVLGAEGQYIPLRIDRDRDQSASHDLVVVPDLGALLWLHTPADDQDLALLTRERPEIRALADYCRALTTHATPFLRKISREDVVAFEELLAGIAEMPGNLFLVNEGLHPPSIPRGGDQQSYPIRGSGARVSEAEAMKVAELRQRRIGAIKNQLSRHQVRHITTKRSIEQLLVSEKDPVLYPPGWLERMISDLRTYDNFELALLDDTEVRLLQPAEDQSVVYWLVKEGSTTLLETWPISYEGDVMHVHIAMADPSIAGAFVGHFRTMWNRISPRNRDKEYTIWWLERHLH